jgi:hypothetical protein
MKLQGRNLSTGLRGDDVKLLHSELLQLGFLIPREELTGGLFGRETAAEVKRFQVSHRLSATGIVDAITAVAINRDFDALSLVQGQVRNDDDQPFTGGTVRAFDKRLRREEQLLGEADLSDQGRYEIRYSVNKLTRAEKRLAHLIVRVVDRDGKELFSSDVIFNAPTTHTIDIVLDGQSRPSEFERYMKDVSLSESMKQAELTVEDVDFVAAETGIPVNHIAWLFVAHKHAAATDVDAKIFYGLFRENAPTSLPALLTRSARTLRTTLDSAIDQQIIPKRTAAELDLAIQTLLKLRRVHLLKSTGDTAAIPGLLQTAGLNGDQQAEFLEAYLNFDGDSEEFWNSLEKTPLSRQVRSIQNSLQLGLATQNNVPLLETLGTRRIRSIRDLARLKPDELQKIVLGSEKILAAIPAENDSELDEAKGIRFSNELIELLHDAIPTAFIQVAFEQSQDANRLNSSKVLARLTDFELRDDDLDEALKKNPTAIGGVADPDKVKEVLKRMQRTLRVAPQPHHAQVLFDEGLDSAASITSLSAAEFQERFADKLGGAAQANVIYRRAQQVSDSVLAIVSTLQQSMTDDMPAVIERVPESVKSLPNFTTLFGSQNLCSCSHCRSVLSPAAYLVDLFEFLNSKSPSKPITKLRSKRPDLEHILLTCDNTNTPLPYIDLVNEVLEFYVAQGKLTADAAHNTSHDASAAELNANPQFVIQAAYDTVSNAVFPLPLPFHRPLEIARLYLNHLGTSRDEVMRVCQRNGLPTEIEIACEALQMSPLERQILTGTSGRPLAEFYKLPATPNPEALTTIKVAPFLQFTSLTFEQLQQTLKTVLLNENATIKLVDEDNPPQCNLDRIKLTGLTPKFWHNAHRFLRLRRITGWTIAELDLILTSLKIEDINDDALIRLAAMKQLQSLTNLSVEVLASLFGNMSVLTPDSLYQKLFLSKAVLNSSSTLSVFEAVRDGNSTAVLVDHRSTISAALRLSASDMELLFEQLDFAASTPMNLESLSLLHRFAVLSRAMKLSMRDLIAITSLTDQQPFMDRDPRATIHFIEAATKVRDSGFSIAQLNYLYRHLSEATNPLKPTLEGQLRIIRTLQSSLQANQAIQIPENAIDDQGLVIQLLSEALGIDSRLMAALLRDYIKSVDSQSEPMVQSFLRLLKLDLPMPDRVVSISELDPKLITILDGLLRLHKTAMLIRGFAMTEGEVRLFGEQGASFDGFDWNELPITSDDSPAQLQAWHRLAGWYRLRKTLPQQAAELADVGSAAAKLPPSQTGGEATDPRLDAIDKLKQSTGWPVDEVDFLVGPSGFNLALATDFLDERKLLRMQQCIDKSHRLGVSCLTLFNWAVSPPSSELADAVVAAAKAKHSDEQWLSIGKPLNDELRERQKSALISYILAHDAGVQEAGITDGNGLFEYFLIDVEMSACAKTSRIKQAISSVQLFIQRCLLNLEDGVSPSAIDVERWEWMKNYRVWEANRKVFLYPENWIEPELRDDKSPFFEELESALLQNDLSWSTAEDAYVKYLEKLDQVARLEPCGMYVEEAAEPGDDEIVHVFGRTMSSPHIHFYRKLINGVRWTPWEKLDQEVNGDHLIPIVRNRRLYLLWLTFEEKPDEKQELSRKYIQSYEHWRWLNFQYPTWKSKHDRWRSKHAAWLSQKQLFITLEKIKGKTIEEVEKTIAESIGEEPSEPRQPERPAVSTPPVLKHWQIKLHWMEHKDGQWSGRQTSQDTIVSPHVETSIQEIFEKRGDMGDFIDHMHKYKLIPPRIEGSDNPADYEETIFSVYLPDQESHFARVAHLPSATTDDEDRPLQIWLFRRYSYDDAPLTENPVSLGPSLLNPQPLGRRPPAKITYPIEGYETLGYFQFQCGRKVNAFAFSEPSDEPFESLARPDGTTNAFMKFTDASSKNSLSFTNNSKSVEILRSGLSDFDILYEHQEFTFSLRPPYQSFFLDDRSKTYFVTYEANVPSKLLRIPGNAIAAFPIAMHVPLFQSLAKRPVAESPTSRVPTGNGRQKLLKRNTLESRVDSRKHSPGRKLMDRANGGRFDTLRSTDQGLRFETFFHPHLCQWIEILYRDGLSGLLTRDSQSMDHKAPKGENLFGSLYEPSKQVVHPYPTERVDFGRGAYACYNWELFFHIPMLIAVSLSKYQRFEDAMKWFHFVFNPMTDDPETSRQRYWNTLPFFRNALPEQEQIQNLLRKLAGKKQGWKEIESQIDEWRSNPFNPHLIARMRLTAYQKHVVMKYIDNIIAWADQLFSRDTLESINEATQLYILAWNILGKRPQSIPRHDETAPKSYQQLAKDLDAFGNALVDVEGLVPYKSVLTSGPKSTWSMSSQKQVSRRPTRRPGGAGIHKTAIRTLNFCVPPNEEMLRYWDTVEDRLFKIRHCMNIEGTSRQLPLFEPPIDPALLVKAKAAGLDLGSVLNDMFAPMPLYRFNVMLQKAMELCNDLKSLGSSLLSAIEKRDAEAVSNLRASQETSLLKSIRDVKRKQIDEAKANIEALNKTRRTTEARYNYYRDIERISASEEEQLDNMLTAHRFSLASQGIQAAASAAFYLPNFTTGIAGTPPGPVTTLEYGGGLNVGPALQAGATIASMIAAEYSYQGTRSSIVGGYARRWDDWKLQETLASRELDQIDKQIAASEIRLAITEKELENHEQQIANSEAVEQLLRSKFTNEELYNWMLGQTSKVYFQTYKLAYDLAKRAERTYGNELGLKESDFVRFGYWDNLRKGLLAGEQLAFDLKRMDVAYMEKNQREYELTKHISLLQLDPQALIQLRQTGACEVKIPEWWFDLDNPGHYMRRIKNVSLSIPCVTGPYAGVNCTLSLDGSETRITADQVAESGEDYPRNSVDDPRFVVSSGLTESIVVSSAQNDSGLFDTNFRDERYLPFENAGAISTWKLHLPADPRKDFPQFLYDTISDVVFHVRYTAREGGDTLRNAARAAIQGEMKKESSPEGLTRLLSVRHEFPTAWAKFQNQVAPQNSKFHLAIHLRREHYPLWAQKLNAVSQFTFFVRSNGDLQPTSLELGITTSNANSPAPVQLTQENAEFGELFVGKLPDLTKEPKENLHMEPTGNLQITLSSKAISDLWIAVTLANSPNP